MGYDTKKRIQKYKKKIEELEVIDTEEDLYVEHLRNKAADAEKREAHMRYILFKKVVGHGEHHPTQSCGACMRLRKDIARAGADHAEPV